MILAATTDGDWHVGIGDPTLGGWLTVGFYLVATFACARVAWRTWPMRMAAIPWWWWATIALVLGVLGVNKQLDLQTWLTQTLREMARSQGWYEQRQEIGVRVYTALAAAGAVVCMVMIYIARRGGGRALTAVIGMGVLCGFIAVRAASFHHIDRLLGWHVGGFGVNFAMECAGLVLIVVGAWPRPRTRRVVRANIVE